MPVEGSQIGQARVGDVLDDVDREHHRAVLVAHRCCLGHRPALLAGGLDDRVRERGAWLRTGQRVAPGEVAQVAGAMNRLKSLAEKSAAE